MRKKGQAMLEFLMTYGWAIVVVLCAIGALAYFGVLKPPVLCNAYECNGQCQINAVEGANEITCCLNVTRENNTCTYTVQKSTLSTAKYDEVIDNKNN